MRSFPLPRALGVALVLLAPAAHGAGVLPARRAEEDAIVRLRFAWPAPLRAEVTHRRSRTRTGQPPSAFVVRCETRVEREEGGGLSLRSRGTTWHGDLPFPRRLAREAVRASEEVVQRIGPEGRFLGLEGVEGMRPVLAHLLADARLAPEAGERAVSLAEGAARAEAEELWNLAVGFWAGADLELGETYALVSEADVPLLPGVRASHVIEFEVRRRVPCAAAEREPRCVEATLRAIPDPAGLRRFAPALLARLLPEGAPPPAAEAEVSVESELLLVTEPATLLPHRLVWTRAARLEDGDGPPLAERVDRTEYDYRYLAAPRPPTSPRASGGAGTGAAARGP